LEPDASVARVARAHGVNANQVFHWRRQYRQGLLGEGNAETAKLLPVHVTGATVSKANRTVRRQATHRTTEAAGAIYVELPKGQLRITGRVDAGALHVVLEQLLG
jgi:transposase